MQPGEPARAWFGDDAAPTVFQWHEEAFALPPGALALAGNAACPHQAFAFGRHLAMQFHIELDEEKLRRWATLDTPAFRALQQRHATTVQGGAAMCAALAQWLPRQQALAERIYTRWLGAAR